MGTEQGTVPRRTLTGLGTPSSCLSPTRWRLKASIELALHWAAAPAGQGLRASLGDKMTKSWKELPLFLSPPPTSSPALRRCQRLGTRIVRPKPGRRGEPRGAEEATLCASSPGDRVAEFQGLGLEAEIRRRSLPGCTFPSATANRPLSSL